MLNMSLGQFPTAMGMADLQHPLVLIMHHNTDNQRMEGTTHDKPPVIGFNPAT